jgi:uncharacterized protein (TIGR02246 family)
MSGTTEILTTVADQWRDAVDAHDPERVASYFTDDAIFQGLQPYTVGRQGIATYYASQPLGLTATYKILETKQLADDLVLGYLTVDFAFTDRPTKTVNLSLLLKKTADAWLITHYQVSLLP